MPDGERYGDDGRLILTEEDRELLAEMMRGIRCLATHLDKSPEQRPLATALHNVADDTRGGRDAG